MKYYPRNAFSSYQEFKNYAWCISKLDIGDVVHFYVDDNSSHRMRSNTKTGSQCNATVIALQKFDNVKYCIIGAEKRICDNMVTWADVNTNGIFKQIINMFHYNHIYYIGIDYKKVLNGNEYLSILISKIVKI